jgi:hypothetical protein
MYLDELRPVLKQTITYFAVTLMFIQDLVMQLN